MDNMDLKPIQDEINKRTDEIIKYILNKYKCKLNIVYVSKEIIRNKSKSNLEIRKILEEEIKQYIKEIENMRNNPDEEYNFNYYLPLPFIDIDFIKQFKKKLNKKSNKLFLTYNPNFDISWVIACPDMDWDFDDISQSKNFKIEWLYEYPHDECDISLIEKNDCFFYDLISIFPHFKWSYKILMNYKKIQKHKEKHKRKYKEVLNEFLAVVYHPDNAERLGLFDNISRDDFL